MDLRQYQQFLNDPVRLLSRGNVSQLRFNGTLSNVKNAVMRVIDQGGTYRIRYKYSKSRVTPVTIKYDDTGIPQTSAIWVSRTPPNGIGDYRKDRAYYLEWGSNNAYAIELGAEAQLFFTAELTGCGILIFSAGEKLIVVHQNIQVDPIPQNAFQKIFESDSAKQQRNRDHSNLVRVQTLHKVALDIVDQMPSITRGAQISVKDYGDKARIFGIKRHGAWRLYINKPNGNRGYQTELIYEQ
ncbi:hypothetical protein [Marinomonas balearica]|uniref:Uncharacterized protein n=1 Tax=Marinomonas balearica TaxID=491947 RepID=A0A4V3CG80_9GAMM|nr:hypothetical protein [Marinomonas balearica]TDO96722.1 hypothetical protein DFP79_2487 [Marinomonas balearica]